MPSVSELSSQKITLSLGAIVAMGIVLWDAFTIHSQIQENQFNIERVEGRLDKKAVRLGERIDELEIRIEELEDCE